MRDKHGRLLVCSQVKFVLSSIVLPFIFQYISCADNSLLLHLATHRPHFLDAETKSVRMKWRVCVVLIVNVFMARRGICSVR